MRLKLLKISEGGRFSGDNGLEVDFEQSKKVTLAADSGYGKTTALELFKLVLGAVADGQQVKDLINKVSGKLDVEQTFVGKDRKNYVAKLTKSQFYVREEGSKIDLPSPKSFIEENLGRVACDPMKYKNAAAEQQIKWLAGFSDLGEEGFEKQMAKHKEAIKEGEKTRAAANKEAKARKTMLQDAGYINESGDLIEAKWTAAEKKYEKPLDTKQLSAALTTAGNKSDKFLENKLKVDAQTRRKTELEAQIKALQAELAQTEENIRVGQQWLEKNANAPKEYDAVKKQYDTAAQFAADYEAFQSCRRQLTEMYDYEQVAQRADAAVQDAEKKKKEIMWSVIPDARGIQIVPEDTPEQKAGLYRDGFNSRQMSASQYLETIVKILDKSGCRILVLDDAATYGSDFHETLSKLAKKNWYILMSEMRRNQELTIEY